MSMSGTNVSHHRRQVPPHRGREDGPAWQFAAAGLCASLVGLGLARFAYTPLIPALIAAKWFSPPDAVYLGAANLAGYLAGALVARELGARAGAVRALRAMMALASLCCFACSMPVSFVWFFGWRFLAGVSGGVIMVLAASTILPHIAPGKRGVVGGVIFAGVGLGVAVSGTLVPLLLQQGLRQSWYGLGVLSVLLTLASWKAWPADAPAAALASDGHAPPHGAPRIFPHRGDRRPASRPQLRPHRDDIVGRRRWRLYARHRSAGPRPHSRGASPRPFQSARRLGAGHHYLRLVSGGRRLRSLLPVRTHRRRLRRSVRARRGRRRHLPGHGPRHGADPRTRTQTLRRMTRRARSGWRGAAFRDFSFNPKSRHRREDKRVLNPEKVNQASGP